MKQTRTLRIDPTLVWPTVAESPLVWRYTAYLMMVGIMILFYTWSRIDAREMALSLDHARAQSELFRGQNERLMLELATMSSLGSLHARALALDLSGRVTLTEVY